MYRKILVALENSPADESLIPHVTRLAQLHRSQLLLLHVADGWAARNFNQLKLAESEEMRLDREYLARVAARTSAEGVETATQLALGDPAAEILKTARREQCDLIAMTTHGHRFLEDMVRGSTISEVRHESEVPLLLVRAKKS